MQENKILNEDEIDLRELFKTIWDKRFFIIIFTFIITLISFIYVLLKNPTPVYEGKIYFEMGEMKGETYGSKLIENTNDLASLINITFNENLSENPNALLKKGTTKILEIKYLGENKDNIKNKLEKIKEFIMVRHQKLSNFYDIAVQTEQIGDIKISEEAINEPKKALIVTVAFITGFILSIFLVFFIQFIQSIKKES
ncbi:Wzz/FepE/Etk N-terminal domain-containing protein [Aliarcobacter cryaerophilus]|uniref:Wzz/FepE/Etk N-terminal domain-containing protein n=1 Tax=Aliarcobacter cryaerophilus TaxID=28198 RepID=UPI0021B6E705|nr:Wzz/FepE/Etk N-terminal domain-containing protein [Aliarcobacter cryaerophilus]MCT7517004.1 Wzz/FepE/Etk N-terminal domain-containing protein [Aliarcobacter cryaerophilus]